MSSNSIKVLAGNSHPELTNKIIEKLGIDKTNVFVQNYTNRETCVAIADNIRDEDVYIIQTGIDHEDLNINDYLMELMIMVHCCKTASVRKVTCVIPNFFYARQDRKDKSRSPITAKLVANLLTTAGCDHVITMDLHASQIQGFFSIPVDNLYAEPSTLKYIKDNYDVNQKDLILVSPDAGGAKRVASLADKLDLQFALLHKERAVANEVSRMVLVGDVQGKNCILIDDMADTCGTLCKAAEILKENGAKQTIAMVTHAILSNNALERVKNSELKKLVFTNTNPISEQDKQNYKDCIDVIDISGTLAEAIRRLHNGESISYLFTHVPL